MHVFRLMLEAYGQQHWWPGDSPFEVMVGALLTQNTNWQNVEKAITNLKSAGMLSAGSISGCELPHLETLIRPSGYFRQKAVRLQTLCRFFLEQGEIPGLQAAGTDDLRHQLLALNGIGPETADSILLYALNRPVFVIDAYTRRIFARLGIIGPDAGYPELQNYFTSRLPADAAMFNEYHALIVQHAKQHCRVRPDCTACPLGHICPAYQTC
ncbi:MAG TPA: endonuclease III domain-containing protein [Mariprofundaceae bacterium]|nr:endonuclease III domain-containing protein [Mariprofundaceae bacterium]